MSTKKINGELLSLTKKLISFPTTHAHPDIITQCADYIEHWFQDNGISCEHHTINNVPSIAVLPPGKDKVKILLLAHFDVVESETNELFSPRVEENKLYGRGAIDDKYAVALSMLLYREHLNRYKQRGQTQEDMAFGLLLTGDEEVGGWNGVGKVSEKINADFCLTLDGGNPGLIVTKEKGILHLEIQTEGKSAHAARPWLGENAFDLLLKDYQAIQQIFTKETPDHWHRTMSLTKCNVGNGSSNMVPASAKAVLDIRYTEHDNPDEIVAEIKKVATSTITVTDQAPMFNGGDSPYFERLQHHSNKAIFGFEHGASDARFLSERNIPGAIWGADGGMSQHTEEEHIVLDSLYDLYHRLDDFFKETEDSNLP